MEVLYRAGIIAYSLAARAASLFNPKARQFVRGRKNWRKNLAGKIETNARYIWVHCASLGEFEQGRPLIEEIKARHPEFRIILTFFSPSGYEIRKNYELADIVTYMPFDSRSNARKFIKMVRPEKVFFIKYEYWYFFMDELKKQNIPLYIVSAIFREDQPFFGKSLRGRWYSRVLHKPAHFFVQDEKSAKLLQTAGIGACTVSGDTRFDRVAAIARAARDIPAVEKFRNGKPMLVAGSTWPPDEGLLAAYINSNDLKMVIAPHEVTASNLSHLEQLLKKPAVRFSNAGNVDIEKAQVLIIDSIGMLSSLYRYGSFAYIGGGFGVGIHNILEAAVFGLPVIFGPNHEKFREAVEIKQAGGAFVINDENSLKNVFNNLLENENALENASAACKKYVKGNTGATNTIMDKVFNT